VASTSWLTFCCCFWRRVNSRIKAGAFRLPDHLSVLFLFKRGGGSSAVNRLTSFAASWATSRNSRTSPPLSSREISLKTSAMVVTGSSLTDISSDCPDENEPEGVDLLSSAFSSTSVSCTLATNGGGSWTVPVETRTLDLTRPASSTVKLLGLAELFSTKLSAVASFAGTAACAGFWSSWGVLSGRETLFARCIASSWSGGSERSGDSINFVLEWRRPMPE